MVKWQIILSSQALKDLKKIKQAGMSDKVKSLLELLEKDPFQNPPKYEKLVGNLSGFYLRRINIQHRLVYAVNKPKKTVHILRIWTHYK